MRTLLLLPLAVLLAGCPVEEEPPAVETTPFDGVGVTDEFTLGCLTAPVQVVRTEYDVPHIYAETEKDLACAQGFVTARDRFFQMDLISRNGIGRLAELLGEAGLESDIEIRARGSRRIAERMVEVLDDHDRGVWEAYAEGVNAFIAGVRSGQFPPPAELEAVWALLGVDAVTDLMMDWTVLNVAGVGSTVNFEGGYETTDLNNQRTVDSLEDWGLDLTEGALRNAGARQDIWENIAPVYPVASAPEWLQERDAGQRPRFVRGARVEAGVLDRALQTAENMAEGLWRTKDAGFGSNAWAVAPENTANGHALLAGDGHLSLTIPSFLYQTHLDTSVLGGGDLHIIGLTVAGAPMMGPSSNGDVAWSHTSQTSDLNDYYRDLVQLTDGVPTAAFFQGEWQPIESIEETYEVSGALGGEAGPRTIARYVTAQGRPIFSLEGTEVADLSEDPTAVNIFGRWIVAGDTNDDGRVEAITGAASHFGEVHMLEAMGDMAKASNVDEWFAGQQKLASFSQHYVVADKDGNIFYSGYQAMACRNYLPRDEDGVPLDEAHPQLLINGELYPSFEVSRTEDHRIDPAPDDPIRCMLSPTQYPTAKNPAQGWLANSNNAPAGMAWDQNIWNDGQPYLGGPWYGTWRASRIAERMEQDAGNHTIETMESMHGDHRSRMGTEFASLAIEAVDLAAAYAADGEVDGPEGRLALMYAADPDVAAALDEAKDRLQAWLERGNWAHSGVETFYNQPTPEEIEDSIATMIFNAWMGRFKNGVWNDEGLPGVFRPTGSYGTTRALKTIVDGVDAAGNAIVSLDPETGESVFFDDLATPDWKETKAEIALRSLVDALAYLATPFTADRSGGFSTADQSQWKWGLKHFVVFENFVAREIGDDPLIESLFADLGVTPEQIPLSDPPPQSGDPRLGMPGFPRPGDAFGIDAAGGITTHDFGYGSGPVMRMVFEMDPAGLKGVNVIPGGQSANPDSVHFDDEAALWIANETSPVRFSVEDVVGNAVGREILSP